MLAICLSLLNIKNVHMRSIVYTTSVNRTSISSSSFYNMHVNMAALYEYIKY